jgi:hypothetical protein
MSFLKEYWHFLKQRKKYWLLPLFLVLGGMGFLLMTASGSAFSPFVYSLF